MHDDDEASPQCVLERKDSLSLSQCSLTSSSTVPLDPLGYRSSIDEIAEDKEEDARKAALLQEALQQQKEKELLLQQQQQHQPSRPDPVVAPDPSVIQQQQQPQQPSGSPRRFRLVQMTDEQIRRRDQIIELVGCVLDSLFEHRNDQLPFDRTLITCFHTCSKPAITIRQYMQRIAKVWCSSLTKNELILLFVVTTVLGM